MLTENFSSIELGDAAAYAPYFRALPLHAADYTFTNLWGWGTHYNLEWRTAHGLCWIRQKRNDLPVERLWAPVGDWYAADWAAMPELVPGTTILRVPEPLCELLLERLPAAWPLRKRRASGNTCIRRKRSRPSRATSSTRKRTTSTGI